MAYSGGLYLPDKLSEHAMQRAEADFRKKLNAYIAALVEADMRGGAVGSSKPSQSAVLDIARVYQPAAADDLLEQLRRQGAVNQPLIIARFIDALLEALKNGLDPAAPFHIATSEILDDLVDRALLKLSKKDGLRQWHLNEPSPMYPKKKTSKKQTSGHSRSAVDVPKPA